MTTSNDYTKARKGEGYPGILLWLGGGGGGDTANIAKGVGTLYYASLTMP